jgi:hypothetical protein
MHELSTMGNRDGPTSRLEAGVWYHHGVYWQAGRASSERDHQREDHIQKLDASPWYCLLDCPARNGNGIEVQHMFVAHAKMHSGLLVSVYQLKLTYSLVEICQDRWSMMLLDCGDVGNRTSWMDRKVDNYNLCVGASTTDTDATYMDCGMTIPQMS